MYKRKNTVCYFNLISLLWSLTAEGIQDIGRLHNDKAYSVAELLKVCMKCIRWLLEMRSIFELYVIKALPYYGPNLVWIAF